MVSNLISGGICTKFISVPRTAAVKQYSEVHGNLVFFSYIPNGVHINLILRDIFRFWSVTEVIGNFNVCDMRNKKINIYLKEKENFHALENS